MSIVLKALSRQMGAKPMQNGTLIARMSGENHEDGHCTSVEQNIVEMFR